VKHKLLFALSLFFVFNSCRSQESLVRMTAIADTTRVTLLFAGDMMGHGPQINAAWNDSLKAYNYVPVFQYVHKAIDSADIAIANFEVTLGGPPFSGYPQFSSPDALADGLKNVGFDLLLTANNHSLDRGKEGLERTILMLDSMRIPHLGTYVDSASRNATYPYIMERNNIRIAFLNYTYGTNGLKVKKPNVVNYIDTAAIRSDIATSRAKRVDFVIVTIHWGIEYERLPNAEQKNLARFLRNCDADAVVGSHPHVVQPFENLTGHKDSSILVPVIYSLGNFVSNQRDRYCDGGIIFSMQLEKTRRTVVKACAYTPLWVFRGTINGKQQYRLVSPASFEKAKTELQLNDTDSAKCSQFFEDTRKHLNMLHEKD
jgi:poly-gamma-glutamate synthesis protein (capsule biosynthesis protein)